MASITTTVNNLETAYNAAADGGKSKTAFAKTQEAALDALLVQLGAYIQEASGGDATIILSSGLEVRSGKTPPQELTAPQKLEATTGSNEGEIDLRWKPVARSNAYKIQQSADGASPTGCPPAKPQKPKLLSQDCRVLPKFGLE